MDLVKDPNRAGSLTRSTTLKSSCHKAPARNKVAGKRGSMPVEAPAIFERIGIDAGVWSETVKEFGRLFKNVAGKSTSIEQGRISSCAGLANRRIVLGQMGRNTTLSPFSGPTRFFEIAPSHRCGPAPLHNVLCPFVSQFVGRAFEASLGTEAKQNPKKRPH